MGLALALANLGGSPFLVTSLPGLFWYLDGGNYTAGSWNDQSGIGDANRNLTQAVTGQKPTPGTYSGAAVVNFASASSQVLSSVGAWAGPPAYPFTFIVTGTCDQLATEGVFDNTTGSECALYSQASQILGFGGGTVSHAATLTSPCVMALTVAGSGAGQASLYLNNSQTPITTGTFGAGTPTRLLVGAIQGPADYWNGWIGNIIGCGALSGPQMQRAFLYCAARFGISGVS